MFRKSTKEFFLIFPLAVANTTKSFFHSSSFSGNSNVDVIDWLFLRGRRLKSDFPLEAKLPFGIFQAFNL